MIEPDGEAHVLSKTDQRRAEIIRLLMESPSVQIKDLASRLDVSLMTIHRDLNDLQNQGLVRRIRGSDTRGQKRSGA